jgi:hypothetical protein
MTWPVLSIIYLALLQICSCNFGGNIFVSKNPPSVITSVSTNAINANGGDLLIVSGENLNRISSLKIHGRPCQSMQRISSSKIKCTTPSNDGVPFKSTLSYIADSEEFVTDKEITSVLALGQIDQTFGYTEFTLYTPMFARVVGSKFIMIEATNNRLLIWNSIPASPMIMPDIVIGQPSLRNKRVITTLFPDASSLLTPVSFWSDGTKLAIADSGNHRVLLWNTFPTTNGQPADLVLGQPNFSSISINNGPNTPECGGSAGLNLCSLYGPYDVLFEEDKFVVADRVNHRLLIWNGWPALNQQPANVVVGQPTATTPGSNNGFNSLACGGVGGRNACSFNLPQTLNYFEGKVIVGDVGNHRILIFNSLPLSNGTPADIVLGQPTMLTGTSNNGPNNAGCDNVLGLNRCSLSSPFSGVSNGTQFYVSDFGNQRILGWNSFPSANQQPADFVIGQNDFVSNSVNKGNRIASASSLKGARGVSIHGNTLWVADSGNHRALKFDPLPTSTASASVVIGHGTFEDTEPNTFSTYPEKLQNPTEVFKDKDHVIIVDRNNNRIIIESGNPISLNSTNNRIILGQPDHYQGFPNNGPNTLDCGGVLGLNACSLNSVLSAIKVEDKLIVTDINNNRILIWNSMPTVDQQPADVVLGQPNFTVGTANNGPNTAPCGGVLGLNKCSLNLPLALASDGTNLIVTDSNAHRVLIWNDIPTQNQTPADIVLGQPGFITGTINNGPNTAACDNTLGLNRCSLYKPYSPRIHNGKLLLTDLGNNRVLIWNSMPTQDQQPADVVIGQPGFTTNTLQATSLSTFNAPLGLCVSASGKLLVADSLNNRVMVFGEVPSTNNASAIKIIGQKNATDSGFDGSGDRSLTTFNTPFFISCDQENVIVPDYLNGRVLIFPH